jgi:hypothetical protein
MATEKKTVKAQAKKPVKKEDAEFEKFKELCRKTVCKKYAMHVSFKALYEVYKLGLKARG